MSAARQITLDFPAPEKSASRSGVSASGCGNEARDACGRCDACGGGTWGKSYASQRNGKTLLLCGRCDRERAP